ncbi:hypothetical protein BCR33DRAFT_661956, partial [Rhizoclosmatium globosum]
MAVFTGKPPDLGESSIPGVRVFVVEHMDALARTLQRCLDSGLTLHGEKNELFVPKALVLGVVLSKDGRQVNPSKVDAILRWGHPTGVPELRSFLGM